MVVCSQVKMDHLSRRAHERAAGVDDALEHPVVDQRRAVALAVALELPAVLHPVHLRIGAREVECPYTRN